MNWPRSDPLNVMRPTSQMTQTQTLLPKAWQGVKLDVGYLSELGALCAPSPIQCKLH